MKIQKTFENKIIPSPNVNQIIEMFKLENTWKLPTEVISPFEINIKKGQIVFITGSSGAGKTTILKEIIKACTLQFADYSHINKNIDKPLTYQFSKIPLPEALSLLFVANLLNPRTLIQTPKQLSKTELYRFMLALTLAEKPDIIYLDSFCNDLDRPNAAMISGNLRKYSTQTNTAFVLATSHDDILEYLSPDICVLASSTSACTVVNY